MKKFKSVYQTLKEEIVDVNNQIGVLEKPINILRLQRDKKQKIIDRQTLRKYLCHYLKRDCFYYKPIEIKNNELKCVEYYNGRGNDVSIGYEAIWIRHYNSSTYKIISKERFTKVQKRIHKILKIR